MFKIIKLILDLYDRQHKYMELYHKKCEEYKKLMDQYDNLYYGIQSLLAQNNEMLVAHYDGTELPNYTIEECKNYNLKGDKDE